jgi:hypothetical protein
MILSNFYVLKILRRSTEVNGVVGWSTDVEQVIKLTIWGHQAHVTNTSSELLILFREVDIGFRDPQRISVTFWKQTPSVHITRNLSHNRSTSTPKLKALVFVTRISVSEIVVLCTPQLYSMLTYNKCRDLDA